MSNKTENNKQDALSATMSARENELHRQAEQAIYNKDLTQLKDFILNKGVGLGDQNKEGETLSAVCERTDFKEGLEFLETITKGFINTCERVFKSSKFKV